MSSSVWYISISKKKIEFKKYPSKQKNKKTVKKSNQKSTNSAKKLLINLILASSLIFFLSVVSAAEINDTFHINLQTTFSNGTIETGTFTFAFNITENSNSSCLGPIVYNYSVQKTTDTRGIVSLYLPTIGSGGGNLSALSFDKQYYLCYYRSGVLKDVSQLGRVPYAFRATQVNLSEISVNTDFNMTDYNITDVKYGFFQFLGSLVERITKIFAIDADISNNLDVGGDVNVTGNVSADWFIGSHFNATGVSYFTNASFNGGWPAGGVSILGGDIWAQTIYVYNITSLNVSKQNLTIIDDLIIYGNTELKKNLTVDTDTLFIDSNTDSVGINTTTPQNTLNVIGDINFTGLIYGNGSQLTDIAGGGASPGGTEGAIQFYDGGSLGGNASQFFINKTSGDVGIGTTSPGSTFTWASPALEIYGSRATLGLTSTGTLASIRFKTPAEDSEMHLNFDNSTGSLAFGAYKGGYAEVMRITGDKKVGIGTDSPGTKLDVDGVITATGGTSTNWNSAYSHISDTGASHTYINQGVTTGASPTFAAATIPKLFINRDGGAASGVSWYSSGFTAWAEYMSPAAQTGCGATGDITAPAGTIVTSWALRNFIENSGGYGWTWESGTSTGQPSVVAELRSSDGLFYPHGGIYGVTSKSYGALDVWGEKSSYSGINFFNDAGTYQLTYMIDQDGASGLYREGVGWKFYWDANYPANLIIGNIPWARVTGEPDFEEEGVTCSNCVDSGDLADSITLTKLTVGTIDPVYNIDGEKYATYMAGMVGIREEVTGTVMLKSNHTIEFDKLEKGSDLWLFYQTTDFGPEMEHLQVILTPGFDGKVWYEKNPLENTLTIHGDSSGEVSYRMTANRFDWSKWSNLYLEDNNVTGFIVPMK